MSHATTSIKSANSSSAPTRRSRQVFPCVALLEGLSVIYWAILLPIEPAQPLAWPTSSPPVVEPMTLVKFKLWTIFMDFDPWRSYLIIWCPWNNNSAKLMEVVRNNHLFSISHMKYGNVGGENGCFTTANTRHVHTQNRHFTTTNRHLRWNLSGYTQTRRSHWKAL
jgi:hypothetical protein